MSYATHPTPVRSGHCGTIIPQGGVGGTVDVSDYLLIATPSASLPPHHTSEDRSLVAPVTRVQGGVGRNRGCQWVGGTAGCQRLPPDCHTPSASLPPITPVRSGHIVDIPTFSSILPYTPVLLVPPVTGVTSPGPH
ncbi:hypothetical protein J6590_047900 [Homalodisca vitripennis]|nr:hypothetical protein J6590_047900 [Homalodisca vitripennis]